MKTGFYDLSKFTTDELKTFFKDCIDNAYDVHQNILEIEKSWARQRWVNSPYTDKEFIDEYCNKDSHNVFIDRKVQFDFGDREFECGVSTLDSSNVYIFIYINREEGEKLVEKYNLKIN